MEQSQNKKKTSAAKLPPVHDTVNDILTIESMFQVKDSEGQIVDLREILDLDEADY